MREIGGYIEFESYQGSVCHEGAEPLNCGRNCLAYLIEAKEIKKIRLPFFLCSSVRNVCAKYGVEISFYHIDERFRPVTDDLAPNEWLYIVNFYGQLTNNEIAAYRERFGRVIVDNAQSYFQRPVEGVDTLYTCRKYFGVPDGGFLYTDKQIGRELPVGESFERIHYILGRFERNAGEYFREAAANNRSFADEPIKKMSRLTDDLLRSFDYERIRTRRTENYQYLHEQLAERNRLELNAADGAFMYPFWHENGAEVRKALQGIGIFVPMLWGDVLEFGNEAPFECECAVNILPLPVDQRYDKDDMEYILNKLNDTGGIN